MAAAVVDYLKKVAILNEDIPEQTVDYVIGMISDGQGQELSKVPTIVSVLRPRDGRSSKDRGPAQICRGH